MIKLDKIDRKILQNLDFNARIPLTQLAKKVNLSKKSVEYRIKQLELKEIILGYYSVIDISRLGYLYTRAFITLKSTSKQQKKEILNYFKNNKKIIWLFNVQGKYDLGFVPLVKTVKEFKDIIFEFREKFGKSIKNVGESITIKLYACEYLYLSEHKKNTTIMYEESETQKIDELDLKILREIAPNARKSLVKIGVELGESAKVIAYRLKQLEKKEIIQTYRIITNKTKLELSYYKILLNLNSYTKEQYNQIKQYLLSHNKVIYVIEEIGLGYDLDFEVLVKNNEELYELIEELRFKYPNLVEEYEVIPLVKELKTNFFPL